MHSPLQSPLQPVMRSPLEFRRRGGGSAPFDIASTNPRAYYDRTVLATIWQSSSGVTPVTGAAQPIGLGLDLSQGGALGPDVFAGYSSIAAPWVDLGGHSYSVDGSQGSFVDMSGTAPTAFTYLYAWEFTVSGLSGGSLSLYGSSSVPAVISMDGVYKFAIKDIGSFYIFRAAAGVSATVSTITTRLIYGNHQSQATAGKLPVTAGTPIYANFDGVDDELGATFPASLGAGCTVCRSLPGTGASITTGVTLTATYTDNVDAHALLIYTAAQWAALDAGQIANITTWLNGRAGL